MTRRLLLALALSLAATPFSAHAQVAEVPFQGRLADAAGAPLTQSGLPVTFALYDAAIGGAALWSESDAVDVTEGVFTTRLGDATALDGLDFSQDLWLEITVGDGAGAETLSPRTPLGTVPTAFEALAGDGTLSLPFTGRVDVPDSFGYSTVRTSVGSVYDFTDFFGSYSRSTAFRADSASVGFQADSVSYGFFADRVSSRGLHVGSAGDDGIYVGSAGDDGVYVGSAESEGVRVESAGTDGVFVGSAGLDGVYVRFSGSDGIGVTEAGRHAFYNWSADLDGANVGGDRHGIYARGDQDSDGTGEAGYFVGDVTVTGSLTAASKSFLIDHPLDPEGQTLRHVSVESDERLVSYSGNVTTDGAGSATVALPAYVDALASDFRYQLTVLGSFAQAMVAEEVSGGRFVIRTSEPGVRVSWRVEGVRQDAWARANPLVVEEAKRSEDRGAYLAPEAFGQAREAGIGVREFETERAERAQEEARREAERPLREAPDPLRRDR